MNVDSFDLNLLRVLDTVLSERNVTRAAKRLGVTQSAVSNSLARLRDLLDDPLFVRKGSGLTPTPRALEIAPAVAAGLERLRAAYSAPKFDPLSSTRTFTIACADNQQVCDVPLIAQLFARRFPRATLRVVTGDYEHLTDGLSSGEVDVSLLPRQAVRPGHLSRELFVEHAAFLVRRDHPRVRGRLTPKLFNALRHIDVHLHLGGRGAGHRVAEDWWRKRGLVRDVAVIVPTFTAAAMLAAKTDHLAGMPQRMAQVLGESLPVRTVKFDVGWAGIHMVMSWHARTDHDAGSSAFREVISEALASYSAVR
jgi:DNA-binding transcriptional LysR family regulator